MLEIKLNLGCGPVDFGDDWVSIDRLNLPFIKYHDILKLPYDDNSVDIIFSSHTISYLDREEILEAFKEWYRVLKVGGKIYISTTDFKTLVKLYHEGMPLHKLLGPIFGKMYSEDKIIYQKTIWDYQSLGDYLRIIGFRRIKLWDIGDPNLSEIYKSKDCCNAKIDGTPLSLNVCAEKNEYEGKINDKK